MLTPDKIFLDFSKVIFRQIMKRFSIKNILVINIHNYCNKRLLTNLNKLQLLEYHFKLFETWKKITYKKFKNE